MHNSSRFSVVADHFPSAVSNVLGYMLPGIALRALLPGEQERLLALSVDKGGLPISAFDPSLAVRVCPPRPPRARRQPR